MKTNPHEKSYAMKIRLELRIGNLFRHVLKSIALKIAALRITAYGICLVLLIYPTLSLAQTGFDLQLAQIGTALTGSVFTYTVRERDSLTSIGARFGIEPRLLANSNALSASARLKPDQLLEVDNRHIVPTVINDGIVINLPQRMLFHLAQGQLLAAYPIAAGKPSWPTPLGAFTVDRRVRDKAWIVPKSIQREMQLEGKKVLKIVPPGANNPLGKHWMGLSIPGIGIHGTTSPQSIYHFQSHGCIRLHPDDAADLFNAVNEGGAGIIIYQPLLLLHTPEGKVFIEAHRDIYKKGVVAYKMATELAEAAGIADKIDWQKTMSVIVAHEGIAREVTLADDEEHPQ
ncbi:MAG: L,D-transpeptidase family protein [Methylophilaceae bacterium]